MYGDHIDNPETVFPVKYHTTRQENLLINFIHFDFWATFYSEGLLRQAVSVMNHNINSYFS